MPNGFADPATDIQLGLFALKSILGLIASLRAQHGMTNDQIMAHAKTVTAGNDEQYQQLVAALNLPA